MAPQALFLITPPHTHNDNHQRIPDWFAQAGWQVATAPHDALCWHNGTLSCDGVTTDSHHLIWPVGLGPHRTFLDRHELLQHIPAHRLINAPASYTHLHGKSAWLDYAPPTWISHHPRELESIVQEYSGDWVLKPQAGSFGDDVYRISTAAELRSRFEQMGAQAGNRYWMLQRFIPQIAQGEMRTLICADKVLGSYLRIPTDGLHANLATHATTQSVTPDAAELRLIERVHHDLQQAGVRFAAIDTVAGYVMEVNIANPGGLGTLTELYGGVIFERFGHAIHTLASPAAN